MESVNIISVGANANFSLCRWGLANRKPQNSIKSASCPTQFTPGSPQCTIQTNQNPQVFVGGQVLHKFHGAERIESLLEKSLSPCWSGPSGSWCIVHCEAIASSHPEPRISSVWCIRLSCRSKEASGDGILPHGRLPVAELGAELGVSLRQLVLEPSE